MERKTNFHKFIFSIALLLFNWPFLSITMTGKPEYSYAYLFLTWLLIIFLLLFMQIRDTNFSFEKGVSLKEKGGQGV